VNERIISILSQEVDSETVCLLILYFLFIVS